jgi:CO dehydrogenase maturation factor
MKIAIAGKGGSGKTTIAGILTRILSERGHNVWAIDADSNPNLGITIGLPLKRVQEMKPISSKILKEITDDKGERAFQLGMAAREVVSEFGMPVRENLTLLSMGSVDHAGTGCMCGGHSRVRHLLSGILQEEGVVTVVDMEAGLEHLSRGTDRHVDALLVVAEPYFKALETARRCAELAHELRIPKVAAVANKFRSPGDLETVRKYAASHHIPVMGEVPYDEKIQEADLAGGAPDLCNGNSAVAAVSKIADALGL